MRVENKNKFTATKSHSKFTIANHAVNARGK